MIMSKEHTIQSISMGCVNETPLGCTPNYRLLNKNSRTLKSSTKLQDSIKITPLSSKVSNLMTSSRGIRVSRDFSLPEEQTIEEKKDQVRQLLFIKKKEEAQEDIFMLFDYFIEMAELGKQDLVEVKSQFADMQSQFQENLLTRQAITEIVVDALDQNNRMRKAGEDSRLSKLALLLAQSRKNMRQNPKSIILKWQKQAEDRQQMRQNLQTIKAMLQEESRIIREKAQAAGAEGWQCPVCISDINRNDIGILDCGHIFHPECIQTYLKQKIQNNQVEIKCPMEDCTLQLDPQDIFKYVDQALRDKFERFTFNQFVQNNDLVSWCPTINCPAVFVAEEDLANYYCPICHKNYCLRCRALFHQGMTCAEYRVTNTFNKNDEDFLKFVKGAKFKQCPKCGFWVERNKGCSTMKCKCGQEFCYECGGTGCPHGSCSGSGRKK